MDIHSTSTEYIDPRRWETGPPGRESHSTGVAWGAVLGGAFVTSAMYLILLSLGAGFDLSAVSPWGHSGATASTVGGVTIAWLVITEVVACALGGYLTGRLRTKWASVHTDEVFFRDTANGFLAWAVALVVSIAFLASAAASMAGSVAQAGASAANGSETAASASNLYFVDALFRSDRSGTDAGDTAARGEAERIVVRGLRNGQMLEADQGYLSKLVAVRTGISQPEADKRVADVINRARQEEEAARKATAHFLLWLFFSLLMGAFSASLAATVGGRQRDHVQTIHPAEAH